jgi:hypothetical protein
LIAGALIAFAEIAVAEGNYQLARNGRTLVWNNYPRRGDEATWTGQRDRDGYARGFGTLVWYTKQSGVDKPVLYARYWGRMVHGRFDGSVNAHVKKRTSHAFFVEGARATRWSAGTARLSESESDRRLTKAVREQAVMTAQRTTPEALPPAEGPLRQAPEVRSQRSEVRDQQPETGEVGNQRSESGDQQSETASPMLEKKIIGSSSEVRSLAAQSPDISGPPKMDLDESIRLLASPPRSLNWNRNGPPNQSRRGD